MKAIVVRGLLQMLLLALVTPWLAGCYSDKERQPRTGMWRGNLYMQQKELPFNFEIRREGPMSFQIDLINGEERITADDVRIRGDSLFATMHIFDTELRALLNKRKMSGVWVKNYANDYQIPFTARFGEEFRFQTKTKPNVDVSGKWEVHFSKDTLGGVGIFSQQDSEVVGTFLTGSGDYRYLAGVVMGDSMLLSAFDGEHAFLFNAVIQNGKAMNGEFRSGNHYFDTWTAVQNPDTKLIDQDSITYLKPGYQGISFSFPDLNGKSVSLTDEEFMGKIVILQLFGSWCPNCMDETKFLSGWYNANRHLPVEIIGLAYEKLDDYSYAKSRLNKMAMKFNVDYEILVAGTSDKELASETLPMLNQVNAFPTTIFLDHRGMVRKIHTGFMGPGTGHYYQEFIHEFQAFVNQLVQEKASDTTAVVELETEVSEADKELLIP